MFWGFRLKQSRVALLHHPFTKKRSFQSFSRLQKKTSSKVYYQNAFSRCFFVAKTSHIFIIRSSWWIFSYEAPSPSPRSHDNWQWRNCSLHHQLLLSGLANGSQKGPLSMGRKQMGNWSTVAPIPSGKLQNTIWVFPKIMGFPQIIH